MSHHKTVLSLSILAALAVAAAPLANAQESAAAAPANTASTNTSATSEPAAAHTQDNTKSKRQAKKQTQSKPVTLEAIRVIGGIAGSQAQDLILKRYAPQAQDSITAVNIGQLPDTTISDALARIPGVQIGRSGGEGTTVTIRGLPQIQTTLNGEQFLSAGGITSTANFIDIPPTLFDGVDVIKSTTASDIAGGISGTINFRTHRPFDFHKGWTFSGATTGSWGDRTKRLNKSVSALASYRTSKWGNLLTASYSDERINNTSPQALDQSLGQPSVVTESQTGFNFRGAGPLGTSTDPSKIPTDYYYSFSTAAVGNTQTHRRRLGLDDSFQYKFNDSLELVAEAMYTRMKQDSYTNALAFQTPFQLLQQPTPVISPDGALRSGTQNYAEVTSTAVFNSSPTSALNTNLQLNFDNHGLFSGSLRWVHSHTRQKTLNVTGDADVNQGNVIPLPDGSQALDNPNGVPNSVPVYQDYTGKYPVFNIGENISDPNKWVIISNFANGGTDTTTMNVYRGDGALHFDAGILQDFKFGIRDEKQSLSSHSYTYLTPVNAGNACANPFGPGPKDALFQYLDPRIVSACTGYSPFLQRPITALPSSWLTTIGFDPAHVSALDGNVFPSMNPKMLRDPVAFLRTVAGGVATGDPAAYTNPVRTWRVNESVESAYGQFDMSGQVGSMPWQANAGLRYVRTRLSILSSLTSPSAYLGNGGSWDGVFLQQGTKLTHNDYNAWLPSLNIALDTTPDQILRFSWNRGQSRQNLAELGQGTAVGYIVNGNPPKDPSLPQDAQIFVNGSSGNPNLQPFRSTNYNLDYEWYFAPRSLVSIGTFFMDVQSFPVAGVLQERLPDADGVVRRSGPVSTFVNGGGAAIHGVEAQFETQFLQLPGWLSGFGMNLNYTHMSTTNNESIGAHSIYNAVLFYQKYGLQVRLAWNWQGSSFVSQYAVDADHVLNIMQKPAGYLDASVEYQINRNLSVLAQATNLTNTFDKYYMGFPDQWLSDNISERTFYVGLRAHF